MHNLSGVPSFRLVFALCSAFLFALFFALAFAFLFALAFLLALRERVISHRCGLAPRLPYLTVCTLGVLPSTQIGEHRTPAATSRSVQRACAILGPVGCVPVSLL